MTYPSFYVTLPFPLQSKSNFRRSRDSTKKWNDLVSFERAVALTVGPAVPEDWDLGSATDHLDDRPIVGMVISAYSRYDASNFFKSVADAVEGIVYINDKSLRYPVAESRWEKGAPMVVGFVLLPPRCPVDIARAEMAKLVSHLPC